MKQHFNDEYKRQQAERIAYLIAGHIQGTLSAPEMDELDEWITASDENLALFEKLTDEDNIETAIHHHLQTRNMKKGRVIPASARQSTSYRKLLSYLSAACLILLATGLIFFLMHSIHNGSGTTSSPFAVNQSPGKERNKAVLTLSDGRIIILDSTATGLLAYEGPIRINQEKASEILYHGNTTETKYNTLTTPRGEQYKLVLSDGTQVWLNAESSLKFPAGFAADRRIVELTGEAFFHVTKTAGRPFTVHTTTATGRTSDINVLGTQFDVNSYGDETGIKTTVLEGSVQIESGGSKQLLTPGQQALIAENIVVSKGDLQEATAWKEKKFLFRHTSIRSIGQQIKRWYNVDVIYQGKHNPHLTLEISRDVPLQRLLQLLQSTREVRFILKERQLIIDTKIMG